ncbi:MAG: DUF4258 domain-containing protein [Magnetococcales bacterium]|nr:DUF4258 domain-containing protein [Magnetococcales bacterium]
MQRMFARNIQPSDVVIVLQQGEVVEDYPEDTPFPSRLLLGWVNGRPLHVVFAQDPSNQSWIVITVYVPDKSLWSTCYKTRRSP